MVEPIEDACAFPHDVGQAGHVDVLQLAVHVAGLHQCDVPVVVRVVGVIRELAVGDEPFQQLPHDGPGGIVCIELLKIRLGFEGNHMNVLLCRKRKNPHEAGWLDYCGVM